MNAGKQAEVRDVQGTPGPHWVLTSNKVSPGSMQALPRPLTAAALVRTDAGGSKPEPAAGVAVKLLNSNHFLGQASLGALRWILYITATSRILPHPSPAWIPPTVWTNPLNSSLTFLGMTPEDPPRSRSVSEVHSVFSLSCPFLVPTHLLG